MKVLTVKALKEQLTRFKSNDKVILYNESTEWYGTQKITNIIKVNGGLVIAINDAPMLTLKQIEEVENFIKKLGDEEEKEANTF